MKSNSSNRPFDSQAWSSVFCMDEERSEIKAMEAKIDKSFVLPKNFLTFFHTIYLMW